MHEYTRLGLSFGKDIFPALSGVARQVQEWNPKRGRYLAGLWEKNLIEDLIWSPNPQYPLGQRPKPWRAPTWSWASIESPVRFSFFDIPYGHTWLYKHIAKVTSVDIFPIGPDAMGELSSAVLRMSSEVMEGHVIYDQQLQDTSLAWDRFFIRVKNKQHQINPFSQYTMTPDYLINKAPGDDFVPSGAGVICVDLAIINDGYTGVGIMLVLQEAKTGTGIYKRIGTVRKQMPENQDVEKCLKEGITIV